MIQRYTIVLYDNGLQIHEDLHEDVVEQSVSQQESTADYAH